MGAMSYVLPSDVDERPISVIGGGTLGRRIAMVFSAGGSRVHLFSRSARSREAARRFVDEHASYVREQLGLAARSLGTVELFDALEPAVATAWLIVESVSEDLTLKKQVFRKLDRLAESDAILATNSSSYPSSRLVNAVESPERLLNVHFQMPPEAIAVELMSCGRTDAAVIDALVERLPRYGLVPFTVMRESVGFLFNRIWHVARRECLMVVAEGVSTPEEVDRIWRLSLGTALGPFRIMDRIASTSYSPSRSTTLPFATASLPPHGSCCATTSTRGSSASSPAGASTTTTATDRGRPTRSHDCGVHAASRRPALLRSTPRARSRPPCERGPIAARAVHRGVRRVAFDLPDESNERDTAPQASTGGKCLVNVHATSRLVLESLRTLRSEDKGQAGACRTGRGAIPCTVRAVTGRFPRA